VVAALERSGFAVRALPGYGSLRLEPGSHVFLAFR